jgi:site-specific DNA-methyltransferase (adenine-specific)
MSDWVPLNGLTLWHRNYNRGDVPRIKNSIRKFGFNNALRLWRGVVMAGNHSTLALREIASEGWDAPHGGALRVEDGVWLVKVVHLDHLDEITAEAFAVADNHIASEAHPDERALAGLINEFEMADAALVDAIGLSQPDLAYYHALVNPVTAGTDTTGGETTQETQQRLQAEWQTATGQVWVIPSAYGGQHRLIIGDCTDSAVVSRLFGSQCAQITFTSPPYAEQRSDDYGGIPADQYVDWWKGVAARVRAVLVEGGSFFVNIKPHSVKGERHLYVMDLVLAMKRHWGWMYVDELCWRKASPPGRWNDRFRNGFEPIHQFAIQGSGGRFYPERVGHESDAVMVSTSIAGATNSAGTDDYYNTSGESEAGWALPDNVIDAHGIENGIAHSALFPVSLPAFFVNAYTDEHDIVFDPFMGSGSTMLAAEQTRRLAYGCELHPRIAAVLLDRLSRAGLKPVLEQDNDG